MLIAQSPEAIHDSMDPASQIVLFEEPIILLPHEGLQLLKNG